uniref:Pyrin domain-containing protein n=1 Tax=Salvator merianae TaxID=96440 RepID=A0A8D0BHU6_SALMN
MKAPATWLRLCVSMAPLEEKELEKFTRRLRDLPVQQGSERIPGAQLQRATAGETSGLLLCYYGEDYAVQVAEGTLRAAGCALQADWLRQTNSGLQKLGQ